ncbi:SDR family oxidoreductase [Streptomyces sp. RG80]|uniref:SDR family oxidoreductase n=1 Tax=Streptomyces sp. RG80 TaxID=3157340 RepID=UPI00338D5D91
MSAYSASKAAVIALTKSAGKEVATSGVLVNVITPAVIATPMNDSTAPDVLEHITGLIPMQRIGRPEEVAELVAFLASDRVSFSTGAVYDISGGRATYDLGLGHPRGGDRQPYGGRPGHRSVEVPELNVGGRPLHSAGDGVSRRVWRLAVAARRRGGAHRHGCSSGR